MEGVELECKGSTLLPLSSSMSLEIMDDMKSFVFAVHESSGKQRP
ncbi:hypothetical protein Pint_08525 [Pistacia integerrima]|uniref:Uncharacterized protein n=1 Tax=Pistacia integerrima TaxID=434235 RepID=A0ACC0Y070_9ROSI|nr:hypothetical protein Pint_08525 [Pistacia integerrima]